MRSVFYGGLLHHFVFNFYTTGLKVSVFHLPDNEKMPGSAEHQQPHCFLLLMPSSFTTNPASVHTRHGSERRAQR